MKHKLLKFLAGLAIALSLSVSASAQKYVIGSSDPNMTTAVAAREWFKHYSEPGADFPEIGLSPQGVQTVLTNLKAFYTQFHALYDPYNAQAEQARATALRVQASTFPADPTNLFNQISALSATTLSNINSQLSADDALKFSNVIEQHKKNIITGGTDVDLGVLAQRNLKELNMYAHVHAEVSPVSGAIANPAGGQGGGQVMVPAYTESNFYKVGTMVNGTFTTKATDVYPSDVFALLGNGGLVNVEPNWGLIGNGPFHTGGIISVSNGQLTVSGGNYAPVFYHGGAANNPYSNYCVNINFATTYGNQYFEIARQTSQGYGYVLWMQQGAMVIRAYTPAYPAGHDITGYYNVTPNAGDSSTLCAFGTQITAYYNDTQILNANNSEIAAGWPGMIGTVWAPSPASISISMPKYLAQTTQISGATTCSQGCPPQAHHQPFVQSQTGNGRSIGGQQSGPTVSPASYINWSATTYYPFDLIDDPGGDNPTDFTIWGAVDCSVVGHIFNPPTTTASLPFNVEWATSFMYVSGPKSNITAPLNLIGQYVLGGIAFTPEYMYPLNYYCSTGEGNLPNTSPPDFNPAFIITPNASQDTQASYMAVKAMCDFLPVVGEFATGLYSCSPGWVKTYMTRALAISYYPYGYECTYGFNGPKTPE